MHNLLFFTQVELQREKLIQFYKDQNAPKQDNTSPADECNPLEETQTFEGLHSLTYLHTIKQLFFLHYQSLLLQAVQHSLHVNCRDSL